STTITQVQGLRACRNAGIAVPNEVIEKAVKYIQDCTGPDGGVYYSSKSRGSGRPAITAAAVACLFNAGEYDDKYVPKLLAYCKKHLKNPKSSGGHWHYTHYYYSQVLYRQGGKDWETYKKEMQEHLYSQLESNGSWVQGGYGPVYVTSISLTILQLDNAVLPIYQR
ncbi:MAG: terpene cyclase/mutase family protein, partial [Planctomycetia bacterium]